MEKLVCKECGKVFVYKKMSSCRAQLRRHLIVEHRMSIEDYIVKHEYNGIHPKCPCGCGNNLSLKKDGWRFNMYYSDTCYGNLVKQSNAVLMKNSKTSMSKFDIVKYYEKHYDRKTYQEAFDLLKSKNFSLSDISKTYQLDKRTMKKVWIALKITNSEELTELLEYNKYKMPSLSNSVNSHNNDELMAWCYNLIKSFPGKYTPNSLNRAYNEAHKDNKTNHNGYTLVNSLHKVYGDEIDLYLASGYHSNEEYKFYEILKFYIPNQRIMMGKKFILPDGYVFFDISIGSKILIEYDSDGFFHSYERSKRSDERKESFAKENGYNLIRLSKQDILKIETIINIKNILENEIN